jgi:hypothetical protein
MLEGAPAAFLALEESSFAAAIRQSPWAYPAANIGHIVSLAVLAGAVAIMDVRLLGGFAATKAAEILARARWAALAGLAGMALTGFALFAAEASHLALNPVFRLKLLLIGAALVNIAIFELWARRRVERLPAGAPMPAPARVAGLLSLALWLSVAACGRAIAYF